MNDKIRGRAKADQRTEYNEVESSGTVQLSMRDRDEQMNRQKREKSVIKYSEMRHESCQFSEKE